MPHIKILNVLWVTAFLSIACFPAFAANMTISGTPPATATVGQLYSFDPVVRNANFSQLQFAYVNLPSWSGRYRFSGSIVGTPTAPGVYANIVIEAWDGVQWAQTPPFTITVQGGAAPVVAPPQPSPPSASQSQVDNVVGIVADGSSVPDGGLDADGYAYSATLLGTSIAWAGSTFKLGAAGTADAMSNTTIALPAGNDSTVNLLATAVNGNQPNQTFVVNYTDGTSSSFTQSLSDWYTPQQYGGESKVSEMAYRIAPSGATSNGPFYLYGYSFAINSAKTVQSITLPNNRNVVVLAVDATPTGNASFTAAAPNLSPAPGTYTSAQSVTLSDSSSGAVIYYTTNGTTPTTSSARYGAGSPIQVSSTTTIEAIAVASGYSNSAAAGGTFTISSATPPSSGTLLISGTPATTAVVGAFYSFTPTVVAPAGSSLTYSVANEPSWMQFSAATGVLSGTPNPASVGTDANIVVSLSNGAQTAALPAFNIAVSPAVAAASGNVDLTWTQPTQNTDGTPLTNLAGYVVRYGTSAAALNTLISIGSPNSTEVEINSLSPGNWYFEVSAINTANIESQFSSIVSKTIQ